MDNNYILSTFNDQFTEFIEDIHRVFPNNVHISTCKNALIAIRRANPKLIIKTVKPYLYTYKNEIESGNIDFFIDKDYKDDMYFRKEKKNDILDKIEQLREPVRNMNNNDRLTVIEYLKNLLQLSEIYII